MRCQICKGAGELVVAVPSKPIAGNLLLDRLEQVIPLTVDRRRYPCPACNDLVSPEHAAVVVGISVLELDLDDRVEEDAIALCRKEAAAKLVGYLLDRGLIDFTYNRAADYRATDRISSAEYEVKARLCVIRPDRMPDESSILEKRKKAVDEDRERIFQRLCRESREKGYPMPPQWVQEAILDIDPDHE